MTSKELAHIGAVVVTWRGPTSEAHVHCPECGQSFAQSELMGFHHCRWCKQDFPVTSRHMECTVPWEDQALRFSIFRLCLDCYYGAD